MPRNRPVARRQSSLSTSDNHHRRTDTSLLDGQSVMVSPRRVMWDWIKLEVKSIIPSIPNHTTLKTTRSRSYQWSGGCTYMPSLWQAENLMAGVSLGVSSDSKEIATIEPDTIYLSVVRSTPTKTHWSGDQRNRMNG